MTLGGKKRTFNIQPGEIGILTESVWRPDIAYLSKRKRVSKFESDWIIATHLASKDPQMAETALSALIKMGVQPDHFSDCLALQIKLALNEYEEAIQFGEFALKSMTGEHPHPCLVLYALACYYSGKHARLSPI